ncbi:MAG: type IV secretion system DNA-binding domain-containing protein [Acidiferrobacteraceae bacterium]
MRKLERPDWVFLIWVGALGSTVFTPYWILVMVAAAIATPIMLRKHKKLEQKRKSDREAERAEDCKPRITRGSRIGKHSREAHGGDITIGGVPLPSAIEPQHFLLAGSTGTGKSLAMSSMVSVIRDRRDDRAVVVDPGGEMMARFWRDGDVVLNPLDARSVIWSPFAEMASAHDADRIAKSMLPDIDGSGDSQQWQLYAQGLVAAVLQRLSEAQHATNADLVHVLTVARAEDIEPMIAGLPASTLFDTGASRMLSSVRGIIGSYLPAYRFLPADADSGSFSIRRWIEGGTGWLWIPIRNDMMASMRPLISAWVGEAVGASLSLRPDRERRMWLMMDELASLGRVQSLADALTQGRKFGLCSVAGLQTVSQLRGAYGQHGAQTLLSCFSSQLVLRAGDPETADWCSRLLGEQQLSRRVQSEGTGGGGSHSGESEQISIERAVLPSEIAGLRDRHGYLRLSGDYPIARVEIPIPPELDEVCPPFIPATATRAGAVSVPETEAQEPAAAPPAPLSPAVQALVDQMLSPSARK